MGCHRSRWRKRSTAPGCCRPAKLHEQVNGEWSFVETQRHLLLAGDAWLGNAVLEEEAPYHPLGFPYGGMPRDAAAKLGLTLEATPTLDEVLAPRLARMATMRRVVDGLTEAELDRLCGRKPAEPYPDQEYVVRRCLKVVLREETEHHRYVVRDLAVLTAGALNRVRARSSAARPLPAWQPGRATGSRPARAGALTARNDFQPHCLLLLPAPQLPSPAG